MVFVLALGPVNKRAFVMVSIIAINFATILFSTTGQSVTDGISELGPHFTVHYFLIGPL